MGDTTGAATAPGTAETPNPEGGPVVKLERKRQETDGVSDADGPASAVGGDGTGGSVNTDDSTAAGPGPTEETSKAGDA